MEVNKQLEDLPNEEWVDVIGYDGYYMISNLGRVKSLPRIFYTPKGAEAIKPERIISPLIHKKSIWYQFSVERINKQIILSKLLALHFIKGYNNEPLYFKDHNHLNVTLENIIVVTKENIFQIFDNTDIVMNNETSFLLHRMGFKKCSICKKIKERKEFSKIKRNRFVNNNCQNCNNILVNNRYHKITGSTTYLQGIQYTTGTKALIKNK